jgi:DNA-binding NarL/FixJ family response regulator
MGLNCGASILFWTRQPFVGQGLTEVLKARPDYHLIACCESLPTAVDCARNGNPAIILIYVTQPTTLAEISVLRKAAERAQLLLWGEVSAEFAFHSLQLGVCGLLAKTASPEALLAVLDNIRQGLLCFQPELMDSMLAEGPVALPERQSQIVSLVARGLKNKEIGGAMGITEATVKVYLNKIFHNLGLSGRLDVALYGWNHHLLEQDGGNEWSHSQPVVQQVELAGAADLLASPIAGTAVFGSVRAQRRVQEQQKNNARRGLDEPVAAPYTTPSKGRRNCACGLCPKCRDNARWEQIFQQKFADPTYYRSKSLRLQSALSDL